MSKPAVFGIAKNETQAQSAYNALSAAGFNPSDISVLTPTNDASGVVMSEPEMAGIATTTTVEPALAGGTRTVGHSNSTKAPEGATTGGITGGLLGGIAGWLIGIGTLAIPGVGPFIAAGPILAALSGAAIGMTAGGLVGGLVGYGIPEYEAKLYANSLAEGHILIGVHTVDSREADAAKKAMADSGVTDIKVTSEA